MEVILPGALPEDEQRCNERGQPDRECRENDMNADGERELQARKQHGVHGTHPPGVK
jgi:hypothetical protein